MRKAVVLGGGISGLSAAWLLAEKAGYAVSLYEKKERLGGLCGYHEFAGLKLDYGPHKIYSVLPGIMEAFEELGKDRLIKVQKKHRIVVRGRLLDYPVRLGQVLSLFSFLEILQLGVSVIQAMGRRLVSRQVLTYEDHCRSVFGDKVYEVIFRPLAEKTWGDPRHLSAAMARKRIPARGTTELILRLLRLKKESRATNADIILYPRRGFHDIIEALGERIGAEGGSIRLGCQPVRFEREAGRIKAVAFDDGSSEQCDLVVSTIPLAELTGLLFPAQKEEILKDSFFRMRHSLIVYLLVDKPAALDDHWIFCSDRDLVFSRVSEQKLLSDFGFPADKTVVCCDLTCFDESRLWQGPEQELVARCIEGLERLGFLKQAQVLASSVARLPHSYPVFEAGYEEKKERFFSRFGAIENIICSGRLGMADYYNVDHCMDMSIQIAEALRAGSAPCALNRLLLERSARYRIVD